MGRGRGSQFAPRRLEGVDIAALPLTPREAFVLSQLDGATELDEVALVTTLGDAEVRRVVQRLSELGVVETSSKRSSKLSPKSDRPRPRRDPRRDDDSSVPVEESVHATGRERRATPSDAAFVTAAAQSDAPADGPKAVEPDAGTDIDEERRARIDDVHSRLETLSHYQLLDVSPTASRKEIKDAYFSVVSVFHPDKYFGKRLGSYKQKLDQVFGRLALAYEVLTRKNKRAEYDLYLDSRKATRSLDAVLSSIPPPLASDPPPSILEARPEVSASRQVSISAQPPEPSSQDERRRQIARRLGGSTTVSVPEPKVARDQALDSLRQLVVPRREMARLHQAQKFREAGLESMSEKRYVSAVNALRIALSITPEDDELRRLLERAEQDAARELAETYQSRAQYEERNNDHEAAARSYERVAAGRPDDPRPLERAASCLLRAGTDPRRAVDLAKRAVGFAPKSTAHRVTLARAFEAAGLLNSAIGELERARALSPKDDEITDFLKRLEKAKR